MDGGVVKRVRLNILLRRSLGLLLRLLGRRRLTLTGWVAREVLRQWEQWPDAKAALREALSFHNKLYVTLSNLGIRVEGGLHPKHRLTRYHRFFLDRIGPRDSVLDVGCHEGALTRDLAKVTKGRVLGIECDPRIVERAQKVETPANVSYVCADATAWRPDRPFDVVVLSNLLEHLDQRTAFLKKILAAARPRKVLIRVPMRERDWLVPMKQEMGVDFMLDSGHKTEYAKEEFLDEIAAAGLRVEELKIRFGEFLCACVPAEGGEAR